MSTLPFSVTTLPMVVTTLPFVVSLSNHQARCGGLRPFDRFRPFDRLRANGGWLVLARKTFGREEQLADLFQQVGRLAAA